MTAHNKDETRDSKLNNQTVSREGKIVSSAKDKEQAKNVTDAAQAQADADISTDANLNIHSPNDELYEGELARLREDNNPIE